MRLVLDLSQHLALVLIHVSLLPVQQVDFMYEGMVTHVTVLNFASIPTTELVSVPQQLSPFR